jgi:hypothetical protein
MTRTVPVVWVGLARDPSAIGHGVELKAAWQVAANRRVELHQDRPGAKSIGWPS